MLPTFAPKVADICVDVQKKELSAVANPLLPSALLIVTSVFEDAQVAVAVMP